MMTVARSFRAPRHPIGLLVVLLAVFAVAAGCSTAESPGGSGNNMNHVLPSGQSIAGWLATPSGGTHASTATKDYIANNGSSGCSQCHGSDLSGGISNVSCFGNPAGCHHGPVRPWSAPPPASQRHGEAAKNAPGSSGFPSCQICHGSDFSGGGAKVSCFPCHQVSAPHPPKPWRSSTAYTHTDTDVSNAPVCAKCHFPGSPNNPANHPATPAPAGTAPGCFNSTLCHGATAAPHALGAVWRDPTSAQFHGLTAKQNLSYCQGCHGTPGTTLFNGGSAPTSCQTSTCHPQAKAHPIRWYQAPQPFPAYVSSHRDSGNRNVACAICHKVDGAGAGPDPNAPSCFSSSFNGAACHSGGPGGANHNVPFLGTAHTAVAQAGFDQNCAVCHAVTGTSPVAAAPICTICHQAGSPLTALSCTSCHARPPAGTAYPNVAGKHAKHDALAAVTGVCGTCHNGLDTGSPAHYNRANARPGSNALRVPPGDAAFPSTYNAKAGTASFDNAALTCANVSCHGGVTAPNWQTGTIAVNTDAGCRACHKIGTAAQTPENNSPYSGLHAFHLSTTVGGAILCTDCHDMANATTGAGNHFKFLNTPQMEGPASQTVEPNGSAANYTSTNQTCTVNCHNVQHTNFSWQGGASHAVPFLNTAHTGATPTTFATNCGACHFETGSATKSGPTCTVCHQAASPLTALSCTSCHARPPAGTAYPNVAGKHAKHDALASFTGVCGTCHNGLDTGSPAHYNRANARPGSNALRVPPGDTAFLSTVNAKAGVVRFDNAALTCANVSCHGGVTAPNWQTGTIAVNTDAGCRACHKIGTAAQTPENNSPYSGLHGFHLSTTVGGAILCTDCHDMANATTGAGNHFKFLNTPQMEGPASQTVEPNGSAANYTAATQTCGTFTCHTVTHSGFSWQGGANHAVPFLNTAHTGVTPTTFATNCGSCHFETGSATKIGPTCTVCHKAGSPLASLNCTSCHARPPSGTTYANIAGKHAVHGTLPGVTGVCAPCHNGLESGSLAHYNRANGRQTTGWVPPGDVAILGYNAKSGTASFSAAGRTCSNVICHGGQTTPDWQTAAGNAIDVPNACLSCHASGTAQYNSYNSGQHSRHTSQFGTSAATCKRCHDATKVNVTGHFQNLATPAFEQLPRNTILPAVQYNGTTCNPAGGGLTGCHGQQTW